MNSPRKIPIMLLHGFQGRLAHWTENGFVEALIARGLDPALIHIFSYGYKEIDGERVYHSEGDIREIASRLSLRDSELQEDLESQVDRLSQESVAAGGPAGVTLICHSMGGIIARYYLSRTRADEFGTYYGGNVARVILIGTPNLGVDLLHFIQLIPPDSIIWRVLRWLERLMGKKAALAQLEAVQREIQQLQLAAYEMQFGPLPRGYTDSPALRQLAPGSDFLQQLNRPENTPDSVEFATIYGDIRLGVSVVWGGVPLWSRSVSFGDLLIPVYSARPVPGARPLEYGMNWEREWTIRLGREAVATRGFADEYLPPVAHSNLLRNPAVHDAVWQILSREPEPPG